MSLWWKHMVVRALLWFGLPLLLGGIIYNLDPANNGGFFVGLVLSCVLVGTLLQLVVSLGIYRHRDQVYRVMQCNDVFRLCSAIVYHLQKAGIEIRFEHADKTHFFATVDARHRITIESRKKGSSRWSIAVSGRLEQPIDMILRTIDAAVIRGHI